MILHRLASTSFTLPLSQLFKLKHDFLIAPQLLKTFATILKEVPAASALKTALSARAQTCHTQAPDDHARGNQRARPSPSRGRNSEQEYS